MWSAIVVASTLAATACGEAERLIEDQTGNTIDLSEIDLSNVTIPDLNDPDFSMPDIVDPRQVAPELNIDIENLTIEAPDTPQIRFPDANKRKLKKDSSKKECHNILLQPPLDPYRTGGARIFNSILSAPPQAVLRLFYYWLDKEQYEATKQWRPDITKEDELAESTSTTTTTLQKKGFYNHGVLIGRYEEYHNNGTVSKDRSLYL